MNGRGNDTMVVNKVGLVVNLFTAIVVVSVKWNFDPTKYVLIFVPLIMFLIWLVGFMFEKTGLREKFIGAQFQGIIKK